MKAEDYQFLKETQEKAEKVIKSCINETQLKSASQYCFLLTGLYEKKYKLNDLSRIGGDDYKSICSILDSLRKTLKHQFKK